MRPFPHLFVESEKSFFCLATKLLYLNFGEQAPIKVIVLGFVHVLLFIFLFSGGEYNDLLFDSKCFFIIPLLDSHLDRYDSWSESRDAEFVELIITSNNKKIIVYKKSLKYFRLFYVFGEIFL